MTDKVLRRIICMTVLVLAPAPIVFSSDRQKERTISLSHLGYEKPPKHRLTVPVRAVFLDNQQIAVSFPVFNPTIRLTTRAERGGAPYLFKTVFVDADTGLARGERTWRGFDARSVIVRLNDREFLVRDANHIQLYAIDLRLIAEKRLPAAEQVFVQLSISGKRLYVIVLKESESDVEVLDADNLKTLGNFAIPEAHRWNMTASDEGLLYRLDPDKQTLSIRTYENAAKFVTPTPSIPCIGAPVFITESLFTVSSGCHSLDILETSGRVVESISVRNKSVGWVLPAPEAHRFCVELHNTYGGPRFYDIPPQISDVSLACFDSTTLQQISSVHLPFKHQIGLPMTISPDATKTAYIDGEDLKIVDMSQSN